MGTTEYYCGATLISDKIAISAAHCYDFFPLWTPSDLGKSINMIQFNSFKPEYIEIIQVYKHPHYKYPNLYDDIAILKLGRRIQFDFEKNGVAPLCLKREQAAIGGTAKILGRGLTETGE